MRWGELARSAPDLAATGERLLDGELGILLVGTVRRDGTPRISPVEPVFAEDELYLGMMWRSTKALDLLRDPRVTVHSTVPTRESERFFVDGSVRDVTDLAERSRFADAVHAKIGWRPEEPEYHLFAVDIARAVHVGFDAGGQTTTRWQAGEVHTSRRSG